jgi:hypothetical protein
MRKPWVIVAINKPIKIAPSQNTSRYFQMLADKKGLLDLNIAHLLINFHCSDYSKAGKL